MVSAFVDPSENVISPLVVFSTSLVASIDLTVPLAVFSVAACVAVFAWAANVAADPVNNRLAASAAARYVRMIQTPLKTKTHVPLPITSPALQTNVSRTLIPVNEAARRTRPSRCDGRDRRDSGSTR